MTTIRVADLHPNPFRALGDYPLVREKVEALKQSIKETTFWDNVMARKSPTGDGYELAYGHHRLQALKELRIAEIDIPIRKLSDTDMLRIMAHENMEEWGHVASVEQEVVAITVKAFGAGRIVLPAPDKKTSRNHIRFAPSFLSGDAKGSTPEHPYTTTTIAKFLSIDPWKVEAAIDALALIEQHIAKGSTFTGLSTAQAEAVAKQASRIVNESRKAGDDETTARNKAAAVARELAAGMRKASGKESTTEDKNKVTHEKVTPKNARAEADRILGIDRPQSSKPPDVNKLIDKFLEGLAQAITKRADWLQAIIRHKDAIPNDIIRRVLGSLRTIQLETAALADRLEDKAASPTLALSDQRASTSEIVFADFAEPSDDVDASAAKRKAKYAADEPPDNIAETNKFCLELGKIMQSFVPRFRAWFEATDVPAEGRDALHHFLMHTADELMLLAQDIDGRGENSDAKEAA